jgi:drug/metabolite transporter (DMT)-like permease
VAQIIMKFGMSADPGRASWFAAATQPFVLLGLGLYGMAALVWLLVLSKVDVTAAYPFVGLGFVVTMVLGWLMLGEHLDQQRVIGTVLISVGVILVARSA